MELLSPPPLVLLVLQKYAGLIRFNILFQQRIREAAKKNSFLSSQAT